MPYHSRISDRLEHRPIVSTLVGAKGEFLDFSRNLMFSNTHSGSDIMLISLAKAAFEAESWPTAIATGRYMFPLGNNSRNVGEEHMAQSDGSFSYAKEQAASLLSVPDKFGGQHLML
jgi:hypothetical protein